MQHLGAFRNTHQRFSPDIAQRLPCMNPDLWLARHGTGQRDTLRKMSRRFHSLDEVLQPVLARIKPLQPVLVPPEAAIGRILAEAVASPVPLPTHATALRTGLAVHALDLAGASPHAPVILMSRPAFVRMGETLPAGCDAVIDPHTIEPQGPFWHATESVEPGADTRLAGHDLASGAEIGETGRRITPEIALVAGRAGLKALPVRQPVVQREGYDGPEAAWLEARLSTLGVVISTEGYAPDIIIRRNDDAPARLALRPADTAWIDEQSGCITIEVPARIDALVAAWCTLLLPVLAALTGTIIQTSEMPLARKLASPVGFADIALHHLATGTAHPLASGDLPLSAIIRANSFSLIPAGLEGFAAGERVAVMSLDWPFL